MQVIKSTGLAFAMIIIHLFIYKLLLDFNLTPPHKQLANLKLVTFVFINNNFYLIYYLPDRTIRFNDTLG